MDVIYIGGGCAKWVPYIWVGAVECVSSYVGHLGTAFAKIIINLTIIMIIQFSGKFNALECISYGFNDITKDLSAIKC